MGTKWVQASHGFDRKCSSPSSGIQEGPARRGSSAHARPAICRAVPGGRRRRSSSRRGAAESIRLDMEVGETPSDCGDRRRQPSRALGFEQFLDHSALSGTSGSRARRHRVGTGRRRQAGPRDPLAGRGSLCLNKSASRSLGATNRCRWSRSWSTTSTFVSTSNPRSPSRASTPDRARRQRP